MRLFISGPRPLLRHLATALDHYERLDVIGQAEGVTETIEKLAQSRVDVLVLGIDALAGKGIRLTQKMAALFPAIGILVLGRAESDEQVLDCLQAGAAGFLSHDPSPDEVAAAVEMITQGGRVCPPGVMRLLFARLSQLGRERKRRDRLEVLEMTAREMEILRLIADGLTNRQIARHLCLSAYTVKNHIHRILDLLGVQSRWEAVNHAFDKGWLQDRRWGSRLPRINSQADPDPSG